MIKNDKKNNMFQSEMENLELGLNLSSSDLLFADDLLNIPLETVDGTNSFGFGSNKTQDPVKPDNIKLEDDVLERIIQEVKLPFEENVEDPPASSLWSSTKSLFDIADDQDQDDLTNLDSPASSGSECNEIGDTQSLIDEMEEFLAQHEEIKAIKEKEVEKLESTFQSETKRAEQLLDALMSGGVSVKEDANDSGFFDSSSINNVSEIVTDDGQKIVIVITNDNAPAVDNASVRSASPTGTYDSVASPAMSSASSDQGVSQHSQDDSDSDWCPSPLNEPKRTRGTKRPRSYIDSEESSYSPASKAGKRGPYRKRGSYDPKDKKERKKLQNVVAARRYRDKKKSEQGVIESEEKELADKNAQLREKLSEMEGEVKTLKKLMLELGLVTMKPTST